MSQVKLEKDYRMEDVDLESVKQLIEQQVPNYGLKNCDAPLFQWPILKAPINEFCKSELFIIGQNVYIGQLLSLAFERELNLILRIECLFEDGSKITETFPSFQHFRCEFIFYDHQPERTIRQNVLSTNSFNPHSKINEIRFHFKYSLAGAVVLVKKLKVEKVEVYVEASTTSVYVSPLKNAVMGKIEKYQDKKHLVNRNGMILVSPRIDFGSADQKMIVRFWHAEEGGWGYEGLWATLLIINEKETQVGPPFHLKVSFTIFNQRENASNFVKKVVLPRKQNKCEYPIFLDLDKDLKNLGCLENDTLYYWVIAEPFHFKLPDETMNESKYSKY